MSDASALASASQQQTAETLGLDLLEQAIGATKQTAPDRTEALLRNFVEQALEGTVTYEKNLAQTINNAIAKIDQKISQQLNAVMHAPKFQKLEGSWRGLHYLVMNSETSTTLKLRLLHLTKR